MLRHLHWKDRDRKREKEYETGVIVLIKNCLKDDKQESFKNTSRTMNK